MVKMSNKKGISVNFLFWIMLIIILIPFYLSLNSAANKAIAQTIQSYGIEGDILYNRLFVSENSFFYRDRDTGRTYPGVISKGDIEKKFTEETLENLFDKEANFKIAFKLELKGGDFEKIIYYDKDLFNFGEEIADIEGSRYKLINNTVPVVILNADGTRERASLTVKRVVKR